MGFGNWQQRFEQALANLKESFDGHAEATREELKATRETVERIERQLGLIQAVVNDISEKLDDANEALSFSVAHGREANKKLDILIAEVSRLSSRGELMLSVFGFCALHDLSYTRGDLARMGKQATRFSNTNGYKVETVADNTFGYVNVYERRALEELFLGDD